jgi:hypothetical protein
MVDVSKYIFFVHLRRASHVDEDKDDIHDDHDTFENGEQIESMDATTSTGDEGVTHEALNFFCSYPMY